MKSDRKKRYDQTLVDPMTGLPSDAPDAIHYYDFRNRLPTDPDTGLKLPYKDPKAIHFVTYYKRQHVDPVSGKLSHAPDAISRSTWSSRRPTDPKTGLELPHNDPKAITYSKWYQNQHVDPVSGELSNASNSITRSVRYSRLRKARLKASKTGELSNTADTANPTDTTFLSGFDLNFPPNSPSETIVPSEKQDSIQTQTIEIQSQSQQDEDILDLNVMPKETAQTIPPAVTQDSTKTVTQDSTNKRKSQDSTNKRKSPEFTPEETSKEPDDTSKKQRSQSILDQANKALLNSPVNKLTPPRQNRRVFQAPRSNRSASPAFFSTSSNSKPGSPPKAKEIPVTVISSTVLNTEVKVKKT